MPFITVEVMRGRTTEQRRQFARRVTEAAVECLDAKAEKVRIVFRELEPTDLARGGRLVADETAPE